MSRLEMLAQLTELLRQHRWAALATTGKDGAAAGSMVAYAMSADFTCAYLHLSELAAHTRNLQRDARATLVVSDCDRDATDPQQLARASLSGRVSRLTPDEPAYEMARKCYLQRLPEAEPLFSFSDFHLFSLTPEKLRYVHGFGQAFTYSAEEFPPAGTVHP